MPSPHVLALRLPTGVAAAERLRSSTFDPETAKNAGRDQQLPLARLALASIAIFVAGVLSDFVASGTTQQLGGRESWTSEERRDERPRLTEDEWIRQRLAARAEQEAEREAARTAEAGRPP